MNFIKSIFTAAPGSQFNYYTTMIVIALLLIISSIVISQIYNKKKKDDLAFKKLFKKVAGRLFLFGALIGFFTAVRYESIPYFSMRLWLYLTLLVTVLYVAKTIHTFVKVYPMKKSISVKRHSSPKKEKNVYLPNKSRK